MCVRIFVYILIYFVEKTCGSSDSEDIVIISDDNGTPIVITDSEDESKSQECASGVNAVSYTHLDVYKRQI